MSIIGTDICDICGYVYSCMSCPRCWDEEKRAKKMGVLLPMHIQCVLRMASYETRVNALEASKKILALREEDKREAREERKRKKIKNGR